MHVVDSKLVLDYMKGFNFEEHGVDELEGFFFLKKCNDFFDVELDLIDTLGGDSAVDLSLEHGAGLVTVLLPFVGGVELF